MKRTILYIIVSFCFLFTACYDHHNDTQILAEADKLSDSIPSKALIKLQEIKDITKLDLSEQATYNLIFIKSMLWTGNNLIPDSVINSTIQYYQNRHDSANLYDILYYKGLYNYRQANHDSAIASFTEALKMIPSKEDINKKINCKRIMGYAYLYLNDTQKAVEIQKEALQYAYSGNDTLSIIYSLINLANAYQYNKDIDSALDTYELAAGLSKKRGNHDIEADVFHSISDLYRKKNSFKEALFYKNEAIRIKRDKQEVPAVNLYKAILFHKQHMVDSAYYYAQLSVKGIDPFVANVAYSLLSAEEAKRGNYVGALNLLKNKELLFNSFSSDLHSMDMQQKYEKEKLENENNQLKIKQKEHEVFSLATLLFILCVTVFFYVVWIQNKRKSEKIKQQNERLRLQQENLLLKQQQEISSLREKDANLRESLFKRTNFFNKIPSLSREEPENDKNNKIKVTQEDWDELLNGIQEAYPGFIENLKQKGSLSADDINFCCLIKINVNMQDLSDIYCVSKGAITKRKYRLKTEKFNIPDNTINLDTILQNM
ncbi:MAG TPA: hypothetical protein DDW85_09100 [Porphyromonadaceae bacterium]|nr:hypothetical protein [Porphyromonadaceae bacterium]